MIGRPRTLACALALLLSLGCASGGGGGQAEPAPQRSEVSCAACGAKVEDSALTACPACEAQLKRD